MKGCLNEVLPGFDTRCDDLAIHSALCFLSWLILILRTLFLFSGKFHDATATPALFVLGDEGSSP